MKRAWEAPTSLHVSKKKTKATTATKAGDKLTVHSKTTSVYRTQLVCSILSQRPVVFNNIREDAETPGLTDAEIAFAKLLAMLTNGTKLSINETATRLSFAPGVPTGGVANLKVDSAVNLGWLIEGLLPLAPFCKDSMRVTVSGGITDSDDEIGINFIRSVSLRLLEKFGVFGATLDCTQRGFPPNGGGSVTFSCPIVRKHLTIPTDLDNCELRVLRIRGVAQSSRVNPQLANRVATQARTDLEKFATDVFINTDCRSSRTRDAGESPGYGLSLWCELVDPKLAETTHSDKLPPTSVLGVAGAYQDADSDSPENIGSRVSKMLLKQIALKGSIDVFNQSLVIMLMATSPEEAVRCNVGMELSKHAIGTLRVVDQFLGVRFNITRSPSGQVLLACVGNGVGNFARKVT